MRGISPLLSDSSTISTAGHSEDQAKIDSVYDCTCTPIPSILWTSGISAPKMIHDEAICILTS